MKKLITTSLVIILFVTPLIISCESDKIDKNAQKNNTSSKLKTFKTVNTYPHDSNAFTQGLVFFDGFLYESTGLYGSSSLRKVDLKTGKILMQINLPNKFFGEGITIVDDLIYQLTWKSKKGFIYKTENFEKVGDFTYHFDGWGITNDGENLIISDGSSNIYFLDKKSFTQIKKIHVNDMGKPISQINELEFINGKIYANIWRSNKIITIDPNSGNVLEWIDLEGIFSNYNNRTDVLNGIAFNRQKNTLLVTGKLWPKLFEIVVIPKDS